MTWNLKRGLIAGCCTPADLDAFADEIRPDEVDIIGFQEITEDQAIGLGLRLGMDVRWEWSENPGPLGGFCDISEECIPYGNAILSHYSITSTRIPAWELTPAANEDSKPKRVLQRVTVMLPGNLEVFVYNTHIASDATDAEKEAQAHDVLQHVTEEQAGAGTFRPIFLCDCNNTPGRPSISSEPPNTGITTAFYDAWAVANPPGGGGFTNNPHNPTVRIDYVFVGKQSGFSVHQALVDQQAFLSDHSAVIAELRQ